MNLVGGAVCGVIGIGIGIHTLSHADSQLQAVEDGIDRIHQYAVNVLTLLRNTFLAFGFLALGAGIASIGLISSSDAIGAAILFFVFATISHIGKKIRQNAPPGFFER